MNLNLKYNLTYILSILSNKTKYFMIIVRVTALIDYLMRCERKLAMVP